MSSRTVAVIGASTDRSKYGNVAVRAHRDQGFTVFPVNPKGEPVEGLPTFRTIGEVPVDRLDRVSLYVPPAVGLTLLEDIAAKKPAEVWLNPGSDSPELVGRAEELGLNVIQACSIVGIGTTPAAYLE